MSRVLSGRARRVLERLPRHMEAEAPGKLLAAVTAALVRDLDVQTADMQGIRLAHRLNEARELHDLLLLAGMHGIRRSELSLLFMRLNKSRQIQQDLAKQMADDVPLPDQAELATRLLKLWALPHEEPLRLFTDDPLNTGPLDAEGVIKTLLPLVRTASRSEVLLKAVRTRVARTAAIHAVGNGTIRALLQGAANLLDLELGEIRHSEDRYWHAALVHDRLRIGNPADDRGRSFEPPAEVIGVEENPHTLAERGPRLSKHADLFHFLRKGFDDALLEIRIQGMGKRTVSPMVVNRDLGHGVGFFGQVAEGSELVFTENGRAILNGHDVTSRAYSWQGACFAAAGAELLEGTGVEPDNGRDFVFADAGQLEDEQGPGKRTSVFVQVTPAASLDREARLPHAGDSIPMPTIGIGKTRFAYFVQHGHFSSIRPGGTTLPPGVFDADVFGSTDTEVLDRIEMVTPRHGVGFADASVFAVGGDESDAASAKLQLKWWERQAYRVRLLLPVRFRSYDDRNGALVKEQLKAGLRRFRPAGIHVDVDFVERHWILGSADLPMEDDSLDDPLSLVRSQTFLEEIEGNNQ